MNPEMQPWNDIAAATSDPQTQGQWPDDLRNEWRRLIEDPHTLWTGGAFPLQRRTEAEAMLGLCRPRIASQLCIMEIGADKGGGVMNWANLSPAVLIVNEVRGCPYRDILEAARPEIDYLWLECSSYDPATVSRVAEYLGGEPIDILFIDGNKLQFRRDFDFYRPFMRPGGLVFMHDITDGEPARAFTALTDEYITAVILDTTESAEAMIREHKGLSPESLHEAWLRIWRGKSCGVGVIHIPE